MPSGPMALPSWVTMNRAALPSGDIISVIPVLTSSLSNRLSGHVEVVIAAGLVEVVAHVDLVVEGLVGLRGLQMRGTVGVDDDGLQRLRLVAHGSSTGRPSGACSASTAWKSVTALRDLLVEGVDAVEPVEQRPERPAHGNVETVWLPIEIALERPHEVVEIGDVGVDLVGDLLQILQGEHRRVQIVGQLWVRSIVLPNVATVSAWICACLSVLAFCCSVERQLLTAAAALRGEQVGNVGVVQWSAQGPGDALHHRDAGKTNECSWPLGPAR